MNLKMTDEELKKFAYDFTRDTFPKKPAVGFNNIELFWKNYQTNLQILIDIQENQD